MADLSISLTPGYTFTANELVTIEKLNALSNPTLLLSGSIGATSIADGSVTTVKLAAGALSNDTAGHAKMADGYLSANAEGQAKMAAGYFSADATGRAYMAAGYFSADATGLGKFANGFLTNDAAGRLKMADGYFSADAAGRLKMADGFLTQAKGSTGVLVPPVSGNGHGIVVKNNAGSPTSKADIDLSAMAGELLLTDPTGLGYRFAGTASFAVDITVAQNLNGRDTVTAEAASTWYYLWAITDGTNLKGVLSQSSAAGTVETNLRAHANFTGYSAKALVGQVFNDSGSNFLTFYGLDRQVYINDTVVFTAKTGVTSYTAIAGADLTTMQTLVPPNGRTVSGIIGTSTSTDVNRLIAIAADANGLGAQAVCGRETGATVEGFGMGGSYAGVPLKTAQTVFWIAGTTAVNTYRLTVSSYTW